MTSQGDWSFADELERLIPEMRAFARSLVRDCELADDLVQDACLKAWQAIDTIRTGSPLRPWLFRILRNEYYQHARRAWRVSTLDPRIAERSLVVPHSLDAAVDFTVLQAVMAGLPDIQREALILVVAAGYTYDEAGKICSCSPGTIKSRVSRAREAVIAGMRMADAGDGAIGLRASLSGTIGDAEMAQTVDLLVRGVLKQAA